MSMKYKITRDNIHLIDSWKVPKRRFVRELARIRYIHPECEVWRRSERSLEREWAVHNLLYSLGLFRSRTKDCDLDWPQKWPIRAAYDVIGTAAMILIQ